MKERLLELGGGVAGRAKSAKRGGRSVEDGAKSEKRKAQSVEDGAQAGFTLIELLIVILVMSLLTVLAVGSYAGVQRQARVDFAADTLVSALREQSLLARSGRTSWDAGAGAGASGDAVGKLQCFALSIVAGTKGGLWSASTDYVGLPSPVAGLPGLGVDPVRVNSMSGANIDTCETVKEALKWQKRDIFDGDIMVQMLPVVGQGGVGNGEALNSHELYFKPPFGQLLQNGAGGLEALREGIFTYVVGAADRPDFDRKVQFDVSTGEAKKVK